MAKTNKSDIQKKERLGIIGHNKQGCLMKIIEYHSATDVVVEFQDEYKYTTTTSWNNFSKGSIKNPYYVKLYNVGIIGDKYQISYNSKAIKEFNCWRNMLKRCYSEEYKDHEPTYKDCKVCEELLYFSNFYEWLHSQENFDKWLNLKYSAIDKDILVKGNKIYSPETCCLVPNNVNVLFIKSDATRGNFPIGVSFNKEKGQFIVRCNNGNSKMVTVGETLDSVKGFYMYKEYKENVIKQVAQEEYNKGNITKRCYDAMMSYEVEITD